MNRIREIKSALIQILYWAIRVAAFPLLVFYFVYRCARDPRYSRRFSERLGGEPASFQPTPPGAIWLHAVSVGEVVSAAGLLREIRERSPSIPLYVSVTTVAGRDIADERLSGLVDGIFYAPIDYAFAVRRVLARIRPSLVVILETEIWPVLYREAKRAGLQPVGGERPDFGSGISTLSALAVLLSKTLCGARTRFWRKAIRMPRATWNWARRRMPCSRSATSNTTRAIAR